MNEIAVCIVINKNDDISRTKFFFESFLKKSKNAPVNLYIFSNGCSETLRFYLETLTTSFFSQKENPKITKNFIDTSEEINYYDAYNQLFVLVKEKYIFAISNGMFFNDSWHTNILNHVHLIKNSGIVSINSFLNRTEYTSILVEDEMKTIIKPSDSNELIIGPYFLNTEVIRIIGGYEKKLFNTGYEQDELCWRFRKNNLINYYVSGDNYIDTLIYPKTNKTDEGRLIYENEIKEKIKIKTYKSQF
jgi:hypothetical protein